MRNMTKPISFLLCLLLVLQLVGTAGDVFAEGAPGGDSSVVWSVIAKDAEGNDQTFTDAEALAGALGPGFALDWGKDEHDAPITAPTVADLRRSGVMITPPAGYDAASALLVAEGASPEEGSLSLLKLARASVDGSGVVTLPAEIFAEDYDAAAVGTVFNGSAERYILRITFDPAAAGEQITLRYTAGELSAALDGTALVSSDNPASFPVESGMTTVSGSIADLDAEAAVSADTLGKQFAGWKLILPSGASALMQGGDPFTLSCSATLEAQWKTNDTRRPITFTVSDVSGEYKGSPYTPSDYTISDGSLAHGHSVSSVVYSGEQTLPGESPAGAVFTISDEEGNEVTDQYKITVIDGTISVSARSAKQPITVTVSDAEKEYDGTTDVTASWALTDGELLGSDELSVQSLSANSSGAGTGSITGSVAVLNGTADVSENYEISVVPGKLTVRPRPIVLTADSDEKEHDGTALTKDSFSVTSGSLVSGHTASADVVGSQTEVGSSPNRIDSASVKIVDGAGTDCTLNYALTLRDGTLTVKEGTPPPVEKTEITVTMKDAEKEYDGKPLDTSGFEITKGALKEGDKLALSSYSGSITGVGTGKISASFIVTNGEKDVSENYVITVVPGTLTVRHRAIVLTADSAEKDFDGAALTKDSFTVTSGSLVSGHKLTATISGSQTEIGSSPNKIDPASVKVMDGSRDVTAQYSIRLADGTLTVRGPSATTAITITMKSAEKVYDGKALTSKDYEISSGKLADGDKLVIGEVTGEPTDAGESSVTAVFTVKRGDSDATVFYTLKVVPGKLTVKPRDITLTADSASKIYDGRALKRDSFKLTSGELVKGHKLTASVSGSQTEIGSSANVVDKSTIKISDGSGNDVAKNYNVTIAAGTLTVSRDPVTAITLSVGEASKVYDGKPYRFLSSDIKVISGSLPSGCKIEATFNPEAPTDAGKYDVTIKNVTIRNASGADVTSQFNISRAKGTLTITQRPLTIETKAANKAYDGSALTERSTPNITGRVEGHQVTLRITGSQTKVGSSDNTVSDVKITDKESGADVTKNYAISYQYGKLTVSEASDGGKSGSESSYNWVSGSAGTLFIKFDHAYDGFEGLQVDGKDLDRSNYTSASGSTEIWLKASYLNTLSSGTHTLKAKYAGGESAQTSFSVSGKQSTRTGDSSRLGLWIGIMAAALVAAFAVAWFLFLGKDRRWKKRPARKNK